MHTFRLQLVLPFFAGMHSFFNIPHFCGKNSYRQSPFLLDNMVPGGPKQQACLKETQNKKF